MLGGNGVWCLCFDSFRPRVVAMHSTGPHSGFGFPFLCISSPFKAPPTLRNCAPVGDITVVTTPASHCFRILLTSNVACFDVLAIARGPTEEIYDLFAGQNCDV